MAYRAFVASTREDLHRQRDHVVLKLRQAGLDVDPMEDWASAPDHPAELSAKRTGACQFCVALIAFRRGVVATNDEQRRSITQIEIDTAKSKGVVILPFLVRDTPENRERMGAGPPESDPPELRAWRDSIARDLTCQMFDAHELPDPLPAITRQVSERSDRSRRKQRAGILALGSLLVVLGGLVWWCDPVRAWVLVRLHVREDPVLFSGGVQSSMKVARLLEGTSEIRGANFGETLRRTRSSFSLFANTFGAYRDHESDFREAIGRGVRLKFVLTDFTEANRNHWESFCKATEDNLEETCANAKAIRKLIRALCSEFPDLAELRLHTLPLFYTLWISDPGEDHALVHLGVHYFGQKANWPAFRMSRVTGAGQLRTLSDQFDMIWGAAHPDPGN